MYHGSSHNFKQFRISSSLQVRESTKTNEGLGIYFSSDKSIAMSYGKYVYSFYVNDAVLLDFRKRQVCRSWLGGLRSYVYRKTGVALESLIDFSIVLNYVSSGGVSIWNLDKELMGILDSTEAWFQVPAGLQAGVIKQIIAYERATLKAYMFSYHIPDIGVVKCLDDSVICMMGKEIVR